MTEYAAAAIAIAGAVAAWLKSYASKRESEAAVSAALAKASSEALERARELDDQLDALREDLVECVLTKKAILMRIGILEAELAALKHPPNVVAWHYKANQGD